MYLLQIYWIYKYYSHLQTLYNYFIYIKYSMKYTWKKHEIYKLCNRWSLSVHAFKLQRGDICPIYLRFPQVISSLDNALELIEMNLKKDNYFHELHADGIRLSPLISISKCNSVIIYYHDNWFRVKTKRSAWKMMTAQPSNCFVFVSWS